ncbi:neurotrophin-3 [Danio aesculapii]|uniref:neurotrophin-3 n=1 Tax=Danio aesculapii TaxID=1142201 RepID=UPI0024C088BB|nr:neurotrophin-3 [Danio aesculapii]
MHWLPLVAMVIASALPFPQSPVPRLVAATIEPGRNDSNSTSVPKAETNSSVDNHLHGAVSDNNYSTPDVAPHRTEDGRISKGRASQENLLTQHNLFNNTKQDYTGGGDRTTREDVSRTHDHRKYKSQKNLVEKANFGQLDRRQLHEESSVETFLKDDTNARNKPLEGLKAPVQDHQDEVQPQGKEFEMDPGFRIEEDQLVLLDAHPRVLFSSGLSPPKHPPLLLMLELGLLASDEVEDGESHTMDSTTPSHGGDKEAYRNLLLGVSDSAGHIPRARRKRQVDQYTQGRERSVCEAESGWVTDKKTSVDHRGNNVTIMGNIPTQAKPLKQYFYETRCRVSGNGSGQGVEGAGCLGVDKKHWLSRCETKQSYVRALTLDVNMKVGWRWIRINSSCVCVLLSRGKYNTDRTLEKGGEQEGRRFS